MRPVVRMHGALERVRSQTTGELAPIVRSKVLVHTTHIPTPYPSTPFLALSRLSFLCVLAGHGALEQIVQCGKLTEAQISQLKSQVAEFTFVHAHSITRPLANNTPTPLHSHQLTRVLSVHSPAGHGALEQIVQGGKLTEAQINQLKSQVEAYKHIARGQVVPEPIARAATAVCLCMCVCAQKSGPTLGVLGALGVCARSCGGLYSVCGAFGVRVCMSMW